MNTRRIAIIEFLSQYYIDTSYYLSEYGEFLMNELGETIEDIERKPPKELIEYIDVALLYSDENENIEKIERLLNKMML